MMEDIVLLWLIGVKIVLVHGGGPEINELMDRLGKKPEFVDGLRVTDKETIDIVQMVLAGKVNNTLVNLLQMQGGNALGLSGADGDRKPAIDPGLFETYLNALSTAMQDLDTDTADNVIEELSGYGYDETGEKHLAALNAAVRKLDIDESQKIIDAWKNA